MTKWWTLLFLGCVLHCAANAQELKVAFATARPPFSYVDEAGQSVGIEIDLMRTLLDRMGLQMKVVLYPNTRLVRSALRSEVDAAATVQGADDHGIYFSDHYVWFCNVAISKASSGIQLNSVNDLDRHTFIIWQDGWRHLGAQFEEKYRPDAHGTFRSNYKEAYDQAQQSEMFWRGRTELIVVDRSIFAYYRMALAANFDTKQAVTIHDIFKTRTGFSVAFKNRALRDRFNVELGMLLKRPEYKAIQQKYLGNGLEMCL